MGMSPPRRRPCRVQAWRRQAFFALSNSTQVLLEPQRSVMPGTPITAPAGASNGRFEDNKGHPRVALLFALCGKFGNQRSRQG
jgi:hypothetical protein